MDLNKNLKCTGGITSFHSETRLVLVLPEQTNCSKKPYATLFLTPNDLFGRKLFIKTHKNSFLYGEYWQDTSCLNLINNHQRTWRQEVGIECKKNTERRTCQCFTQIHKNAGPNKKDVQLPRLSFSGYYIIYKLTANKYTPLWSMIQLSRLHFLIDPTFSSQFDERCTSVRKKIFFFSS